MTLYKKPAIRELTPQERAFMVACELVNGRQLTTHQIAEMTGLTRQGAHRMMSSIRYSPIRQENGRWLIEASPEKSPQLLRKPPK